MTVVQTSQSVFEPVAVIDIGTSAIRMAVAEVGPKTEMRLLENLQKNVNFGKDVFSQGRISRQSLNEGITILSNFGKVIESYGVKKVLAIATSAVREAQNRDNFLDRIFVRTGIDVEVIEGPEENRLSLMAVEHAVEGKIDLNTRNCLIVEVGSGSTEMIILDKGQVEINRTLTIGSMRLPEGVEISKTTTEVIQKVLKRHVREIAVYAAREFNLENVDTFICLGGEVRFVGQQLAPGDNENKFYVVEKKAFTQFVNRMLRLTTDELTQQLNMSYAESESLRIALLYHSYFLNETKAEQLIIPKTSIRDGLLLELAQRMSGYKRTNVSKQIMNSAHHLGEKYKYDKPHVTNVASLALKLFDLLKKEHGLGLEDRILLEVSCILHDIGTYISPASHHKHSSYLVDSSEIFGLRQAEKRIVSNVVRYHRKATPKFIHEPYMSLPRSDRSRVSKLSAILRVADALDQSHQQRITQFELEATDKYYIVWVPAEVGDIAPERAGLKVKGNMFGDVFGVPIVLRRRAIQK
jgi:exopolyphosphatase/guanosine-5'-triphosphate,3'-diphosphate pyrophosphatase